MGTNAQFTSPMELQDTVHERAKIWGNDFERPMDKKQNHIKLIICMPKSRTNAVIHSDHVPIVHNKSCLEIGRIHSAKS